MKVTVEVNGVAHERDVEPRTLLVYFLRGLGLTAVSYTHLDVYKRQSRTCSSSRSGFSATSETAAITMPGVQYPHWSCLLYTSRCV